MKRHAIAILLCAALLLWGVDPVARFTGSLSGTGTAVCTNGTGGITVSGCSSGSGTVNSGTGGQIAYYATTGTTLSGASGNVLTTWATFNAGAGITSPIQGTTVSFTDGTPYTAVYSGSAWNYFYPPAGNFPVTPPPTSGWTWVNQNSASVDATHGTLDFSLPNWSGSDRLYIRTPANSPSRTLTVGITVNATQANFYDYGPGESKSSDNTFAGSIVAYSGGAIWRWLAAGSTTDATGPTSFSGIAMLIKITNTAAGNVKGYFSPVFPGSPNLFVEFDNGGGVGDTGYDRLALVLDRINAGSVGASDYVRVWHWKEESGIH